MSEELTFNRNSESLESKILKATNEQGVDYLFRTQSENDNSPLWGALSPCGTVLEICSDEAGQAHSWDDKKPWGNQAVQRVNIQQLSRNHPAKFSRYASWLDFPLCIL